MNNRTINGWRFKFVSQDNGNDQFFQCRGAIMYDDYHDQTPEPKLWIAAVKLEKELLSEGYLAEANHSEKGWVEVTIN